MPSKIFENWVLHLRAKQNDQYIRVKYCTLLLNYSIAYNIKIHYMSYSTFKFSNNVHQVVILFASKCIVKIKLYVNATTFSIFLLILAQINFEKLTLTLEILFCDYYFSPNNWLTFFLGFCFSLRCLIDGVLRFNITYSVIYLEIETTEIVWWCRKNCI